MGRKCEEPPTPHVTSEAEVRAATGKGWQEWFSLLEGFGVEQRGHGLTVKFLMEHHALTRPWAEEVALRYERDRGLRSPLA